MKFSAATVSLAIALLSVAVKASPANALGRRGNQFVTGPCTQDSDCQQGCCAFRTGKCAGPAVAQTRDGGCGFGNPKPNCNVAKALKLSDCVAGAVNGDLSDPAIQQAAAFVSNLDGIPFTPITASSAPSAVKNSGDRIATPANSAPATIGTQFVTGQCKADSDCQQGCCAFNTGKCAGPGIAQTRDGGCGFGNAKPNCNVAKALKLSECVAGAVNGDLSDPLIQAQAAFVSKLDNIPFTPIAASSAPSAVKNSGDRIAAPPPAKSAPVTLGTQFVTGQCKADSDCQQGCCAFKTGKCAGPAVAQTRDGGCGFGNAKPNCNVAKALGLSDCVAGAVNGNLNDPLIQAQAAFVSKLDNIPFTPSSGSAVSNAGNRIAAPPAKSAPVTLGTQFVTGQCKADSDCQQGCCAFKTGKCAGPAVAQTRDGGCGFGNAKPNCNVAKALGLSDCVAGAVNGNLKDPLIQAQAAFVSKLDGIPFTPQ